MLASSIAVDAFVFAFPEFAFYNRCGSTFRAILAGARTRAVIVLKRLAIAIRHWLIAAARPTRWSLLVDAVYGGMGRSLTVRPLNANILLTPVPDVCWSHSGSAEVQCEHQSKHDQRTNERRNSEKHSVERLVR